jgi:hypothetical protein
MEDPDGAGPVTGKMVAEEAVRLWCIRDVYGKPDPTNSNNRAIFAPEWWSYVTKFHQRCKIGVQITDEKKRFGPVCAKIVAAEVGLSEPQIEKCIAEQYATILETQERDRAWSPTALRINGWRYSGPHDSEVVTRAICSGYVIRPAACNQLASHIPVAGSTVSETVEESQRTSFATTLFVLLASLGLLAVALHCHRRNMVRDVRSLYQADVRTEVKSHMGQYTSLRA